MSENRKKLQLQILKRTYMSKLVEPIAMKQEFCDACQENPCMCSDPEQTSTVYDW